ncbi:MAG: type II toxin-antitoxin system RelE/ParE family toxin [Coriobacteriales bacterium]|jgi:proteic killer suppression protein|nr:type II toxin-antitoxin system RelE/ParE family toxin [Coriobacteriales bacterium]
MIRSFADKQTERLFLEGKAARVPPDVVARALRKLTLLDSAVRLEDLKTPPGNRLHSLAGDRARQFSISVNNQWRICFRFDKGDAHDVEFCDYHQEQVIGNGKRQNYETEADTSR